MYLRETSVGSGKPLTGQPPAHSDVMWQRESHAMRQAAGLPYAGRPVLPGLWGASINYATHFGGVGGLAERYGQETEVCVT